MANLAQITGVLQSLILTSGDSMLLTPTYYMFDGFKVHQDVHSLFVKFNSPDYSFGDSKIPAANASASRDSINIVHISLTATMSALASVGKISRDRMPLMATLLVVHYAVSSSANFLIDVSCNHDDNRLDRGDRRNDPATRFPAEPDGQDPQRWMALPFSQPARRGRRLLGVRDAALLAIHRAGGVLDDRFARRLGRIHNETSKTTEAFYKS
jgi:hypothetical protein